MILLYECQDYPNESGLQSVIELQKKKLGLVHLGMEKLTKQDLRVEKLKVRTYEDFIH